MRLASWRAASTSASHKSQLQLPFCSLCSVASLRSSFSWNGTCQQAAECSLSASRSSQEIQVFGLAVAVLVLFPGPVQSAFQTLFRVLTWPPGRIAWMTFLPAWLPAAKSVGYLSMFPSLIFKNHPFQAKCLVLLDPDNSETQTT